MTRRSLLEEGFWDQKLTAPWTDVPLERDKHGIEWEKAARRRNPDRVRARLEQAIDHWIAQAREIPGFDELAPPIPQPRTVFDLRGATAGMAVTERSLLGEAEQWIRIHPQLLARYPVRMIQQTIPHEVAHLVVDWYLPKATDAHGPEWMAVMVFFGRPPLLFHNMEGLRHARRK